MSDKPVDHTAAKAYAAESITASVWPHQVNLAKAYLEAAANQRTPGTTEVCVRCQVDCKGRDMDQNEVVGNRWIDCLDPTCPIKQVPHEKA